MDIVAQLRRDEAVRHFPYTDTVGKLTIGVGRNLTDVGLRDTEIDFLLRNDISEKATQLSSRFPWFSSIDEARRGVLLNMAFNLGLGGLLGFPKFLAAVSRSEWEVAAMEMLDSAWASQVGARAQRLAQQIRSGQWV